MTTFYDMAKSRRSVRTFDGKAVNPEIIDDLRSFIDKISNPYNIEVTFEILDAKENKLSSPVLAGEKVYIAAKVQKQEHAEEAYGYSFEAVLMHAHELGLGTVWIGGTMPRDKFEAAAKVSDNEIMPCVSPLGVTADKMSIKEGLMRKGVKADTRIDFDKLFYDSDFNNPLNEDVARVRSLWEALEAVRIAPSAVNKQPWRVVIDGNSAHFYEKKDKSFAGHGDYDLQKVDIGIALYHFEQELLCEGKKPKLEITDPKLEISDDMEYIATYRW